MTAALDLGKEAFVIYVAYLGAKIFIHPTWKAWIALLLAEKITVPDEYLDFGDVFSKDSAAEQPPRSDINKYAIDLKLGKEPPYKPIYSLEPVEFQTLKTYIKTNLANGFIRPSKSFAGALILFV